MLLLKPRLHERQFRNALRAKGCGSTDKVLHKFIRPEHRHPNKAVLSVSVYVEIRQVLAEKTMKVTHAKRISAHARYGLQNH